MLLAAPQTYMNESGRAVRQIVDFFGLALCDLLLVCDDFNLELAGLRMRAGGSAGGQKGLADTIRHLGTEEFSRLRIGIGRPPEMMDAADFVLSRFKKSEIKTIESAVIRAAEGVELLDPVGTRPGNEPGERPGRRLSRRNAKHGVANSGRTRYNEEQAVTGERNVAETTVAEKTGTEKLYEGMFLLDSGRFATDAKGSADQILGMLEKCGGSIVAHRPGRTDGSPMRSKDTARGSTTSSISKCPARESAI